MAIDYNEVGQGLANLLFVQPNMTASLTVSDLATFASAIDVLLGGLTVTQPQLNADQISSAIAYVAAARAGMN